MAGGRLPRTDGEITNKAGQCGTRLLGSVVLSIRVLCCVVLCLARSTVHMAAAGLSLYLPPPAAIEPKIRLEFAPPKILFICSKCRRFWWKPFNTSILIPFGGILNIWDILNITEMVYFGPHHL